ncbi:hypothetical protein [Saccharopolyspora spinosa]|uniref:hypothetical protein n=1 Tax=Saccharopolyspora spinosa TaxID=60894 RepID=UPI00376F0DC4
MVWCLAGGGLGMAGLADSSAVVAVSGQETVARDETAAQARSGQAMSGQAGSVVGDAQPGATVSSSTDMLRDTGGMPVRQWSAWDLRREIDGARQGGWSGDDELAAGWIVRGGYDPRTLGGPLVGDSAESSPSGVGWFGVESRGRG